MGHQFPLVDMVPHQAARKRSRMYTHMSCCHPMKAFWTGGYTDSGKLELVIMPSTSGDLLNVGMAESRGFRVLPSAPLKRVGMNTYITDPLAIPCGHCVGCRMDKARAWKIRNCHEAELYPDDEIHFVTLTYDDRHLPLTADGEPVLKPEDLRQFLDNLRCPEYGVKRKFRHFACGEYGELGHRPHMHLLLYGKLDDCIPYAWKCSTSATIGKAWPYGFHQVKPVEEELIAYVCGYVEKKQMDPFWFSYPVKPFLRMSTRPGIGSWYASRLTGSPDRKVYGSFHQHYAGIPRAYLKLCEGKDWFASFKAASVDIAKQTLLNNMGALGVSDEEILGDICEAAMLESLENLRRPKL